MPNLDVDSFGRLVVTLTTDERRRGGRVGWERHDRALRLGLQHRWHPNGRFSEWVSHIEGASAELAIALVLDEPWTSEEWSLDENGKPDVGDDVEVRWSMSNPPLLHFQGKRDCDERLYVLTSGYSPRFIVHGCLRGYECQLERWLHAYPERTVYRVPTSALHPLGQEVLF